MWRGRLVTYGVLGVMAGAVLGGVEAWPITSFQLFSRTRTGQVVSLELVATTVSGSQETIHFAAGGQVSATTRLQLRTLPTLSAAEQRRKVDAWLALAHVDRSSVTVVALEKVTRELDPDDGPPTVRKRAVLAVVRP